MKLNKRIHNNPNTHNCQQILISFFERQSATEWGKNIKPLKLCFLRNMIFCLCVHCRLWNVTSNWKCYERKRDLHAVSCSRKGLILIASKRDKMKNFPALRIFTNLTKSLTNNNRFSSLSSFRLPRLLESRLELPQRLDIRLFLSGDVAPSCNMEWEQNEMLRLCRNKFKHFIYFHVFLRRINLMKDWVKMRCLKGMEGWRDEGLPNSEKLQNFLSLFIENSAAAAAVVLKFILWALTSLCLNMKKGELGWHDKPIFWQNRCKEEI